MIFFTRIKTKNEVHNNSGPLTDKTEKGVQDNTGPLTHETELLTQDRQHITGIFNNILASVFPVENLKIIPESCTTEGDLAPRK